MAKKMPIAKFVAELEAALKRKDGYIMGAKGQNPKKWSKTSWWFAQYDPNSSSRGSSASKANHKKALYWRENAERVWDCNGLAEGIYADFSGVNIDTKAKYNYSGWCGIKGTGMIPAKYRQPGAAVFWGKTAAKITHVAYLYKPVNPAKPAGDWYIIEARGVNYGVVKTKLLSRKPNYWGLMTKYFDHTNSEDYVPSEPELGERLLKNGMEGADVKELQEALIKLGYDLGARGANGDFSDATEMAVEKFQKEHGCEADGEYGPITHKALLAAQEAAGKVENPRKVHITGGNCWARSAPSTSGKKLGVAYDDQRFIYGGTTSENGWHLIEYKNQNAWVSGKYGKLEA